MGKFIDLTNQRFGKLIVIKRVKNLGKSTTWLCKCDCGQETLVRSVSLKTRNTSSCGCGQKALGNKSRRWKGHGEISSHFWYDIIQSAKRRNIEFSISIEDGWNIFLKQNKKCALTNRELQFAVRCGLRGNASLDRIDNNKGYITGNVQWVHKDVNRMKWILSNNEFINFCYEVVAYNEKKK